MWLKMPKTSFGNNSAIGLLASNNLQFFCNAIFQNMNFAASLASKMPGSNENKITVLRMTIKAKLAASGIPSFHQHVHWYGMLVCACKNLQIVYTFSIHCFGWSLVY